MNPLFLDAYDRELQYLREMGREFADRYPKVGRRLGLHAGEVADPHVERLLEGVAFLAARVHLKIDSEFGTFVDGLVDLVAPHLTAPRPAAMIARFEPDDDKGSLAEGVVVPRGTSLRSSVPGSRTACDFRTTREFTLWPLQVVGAEYVSRQSPRSSEIPGIGAAGCAISLSFRVTAGLRTDALAVEALPLQLNGDAGQAERLFELLVVGTTRVLVRDDVTGRVVSVADGHVEPLGFEDDESLFPLDPRTSRGHRLLAEYFLLPAKFASVCVRGLGEAVRGLATDRWSLLLLPEGEDSALERRVTPRDLELFCTPAVNLFPKRADRIRTAPETREYHVLPDRSRPTDFEVWQIRSVTGFDRRLDDGVPFVPAHGVDPRTLGCGVYGKERRPRVPSERVRREQPAERDLGTEVFLTLTAPEGGLPADLPGQLSVETFCTNRDLAARLPHGCDFGVDVALPVARITAAVGPTPPRPPLVFGGRETGWKFLSHLSLNHLSLLDDESSDGPAALVELLQLYCDPDDRPARRQLEGVLAITARNVVRRLPIRGPLVHGRGLEIDVRCDEESFPGRRAVPFVSVLERFLSEYVSLNSFTRTVLTTQRGEVHRWPIRTGRRPTL